MKQPAPAVIFFPFFLFFFFVAQTIAAEKSDTTPMTLYNSTKNTITINASNASLLELMKRIGLQTGIQIHADFRANRIVNYHVINAPLEKTIKQLTNGLNTSIIYTEKTQNNDTVFIIAEIEILPDEQENNENLTALSTLDSSAIAYAHFNRETSTKENKITTANMNHMQTRWLSRISKLPLEERSRIENIISQHKKTRKEITIRQNEARDKRRKISEKKQNHINKKNASLEKTNPERYQLRQQRLTEIQARIND